MESYRGHLTCGRCGQRDPNHMKEDCPSETECPNCQEDQPAFSRSCDTKREMELLEINYERNIIFLS